MHNPKNDGRKEGAPSWGLLLFISLILTMQVTVKADDIEVQRIDTIDGDTLYAWEDVDQHIPHVIEGHALSTEINTVRKGLQ